LQAASNKECAFLTGYILHLKMMLFAFFFRPLTGEVAEAIGTSFASETNRRDEDAEM
jgi:hypothetical protein